MPLRAEGRRMRPPSSEEERLATPLSVPGSSSNPFPKPPFAPALTIPAPG